MTTFVFYTIGDQRHGLGHVVRDLVLAQELLVRGHDVRFITEPNTAGLARIQAAGFPWRVPGGWYSDNVLPYAGDVMILDLEHGPSREQLREARATYAHVVNIGGVGFAISNPAEIAELVDLEIYGGELFARLPSPRLLAGPRYLIIDPAFRNCRPNYASGHVVVAMGGADPHHLTAPAAWALRDCGREVRAIVGPAAAEIKIDLPGVEVVRAPQSLVTHLDGAALCLTATGMTAYEALAAGVPCLLTSWSGDHLATARELARRGAVKQFGTWQDFDAGEMANETRELLFNPSGELFRMGVAGRVLVDGQGARRVADRLERLGEEVPA